MKQGDFSTLAKQYHYRPGYSIPVLRMIASYVGAFKRKDFQVADIGAGTGKLTIDLNTLGLHGFAIEPNDAMREEGIAATTDLPFVWFKGSGEHTSLTENSVDWVLMASSFHWTDAQKALAEFYRILNPGGFFTALWNPRDIEENSWHTRIEKQIYQIVPNLKRVSSGNAKFTEKWEKVLVSTGHFKNVIFTEASYNINMSVQQYLGAWSSVNDIQAQAGAQKFDQIMEMLRVETAGMHQVVVPYKTRAWTAERNN